MSFSQKRFCLTFFYLQQMIKLLTLMLFITTAVHGKGTKVKTQTRAKWFEKRLSKATEGHELSALEAECKTEMMAARMQQLDYINEMKERLLKCTQQYEAHLSKANKAATDWAKDNAEMLRICDTGSPDTECIKLRKAFDSRLAKFNADGQVIQKKCERKRTSTNSVLEDLEKTHTELTQVYSKIYNRIEDMRRETQKFHDDKRRAKKKEKRDKIRASAAASA